MTDPKLFTEENKQKILELTGVDKEISLVFFGLLSHFVNNQPQYYFNRDVSEEVCINLTYFYNTNQALFLQALILNQERFFDSINSFFHVVELFKELDNVAFENELKIKLYYLPIIQQLMEYCLNSFYAGINLIINEFVDGDFSNANKLGSYKDNLTSSKLGDNKFNRLTTINIDFRNAISHGQVDFSDGKVTYAYKEKGTRQTTYGEFKSYELDRLKDDLFDIASGAIIGWIRFLINNHLVESIWTHTLPEETKFEYFKFFFQNDNIRISSFSKGIIGTPQLNIQMKIENINDSNSIIHLSILLLKAMYQFFPEYDRYFINYKHPFSITGMIGLNKDVIESIMHIEDITTIDKLIVQEESIFLIPEIQESDSNYKAYKFQVFPKLQGKDWEISEISDISVENTKRYKCTLIIDDLSIKKDEIMSILFSVSKKIRQFENQKNPYTKIKFGKVEADVVYINVFYRQYERKPLSLLANNEYFICSVYYYKSKSTHRLDVPFPQNYIFETIKNFEVYWNKNWSV